MNGKQKQQYSVPLITALIISDVCSLIEKGVGKFESSKTTISVRFLFLNHLQIPIDWNGKKIRFLRWVLKALYPDPFHYIYDIDAIALQYGFYNFHHTKEESCVMFVEIGYLHATVFVVQYHSGGIRVLYCQPVEGCSGRDFDKILTNMVYERITQDKKIDEKDFRPRDRMAILSQCEKTKQFLGVNGLPDHDLKCTSHSRDVVVHFTTSQFNEEAEPIMKRLKKACMKCLLAMHKQYREELKTEAAQPGTDSIIALPQPPSPPKRRPISTIVLEGSSSRFLCVANAMRQVVKEYTKKVESLIGSNGKSSNERVRIDIK